MKRDGVVDDQAPKERRIKVSMVSAGRFAVIVLSGMLRLAAQTNPGAYVDSKVCATCHRDIAADYARTGMGRSFFIPGAIPGPANTVENYAKTPEYYHALSDSHYSMTVRNGQYFQRRWQLDGSGKEINVEELKIDYVMGSGNHARSYLHRTESGMLFELPLGWYPDKGGEWGMVPGSDTERPQTRRFISYKCMFCHNGYPNIRLRTSRLGAIRCSSASFRKGSIARDAMVPVASMFVRVDGWGL